MLRKLPGEDVLKLLGRVPVAPFLALLFGGVALILLFAMPSWRLEQVAAPFGLDRWLSVAQPPLGLKARSLVALMGGATIAVAIWVLARLASRWITPSHRAVSVPAWAGSDASLPVDTSNEVAPPDPAEGQVDNIVAWPSLPRFLRKEPDDDAPPFSNLPSTKGPEDELSLDAPIVAEAPNRPHLVLVPEQSSKAEQEECMAALYVPQPDPVFLQTPPPVRPPAALGERNATFGEDLHMLVDRLERSLARASGEARHPSPKGDEATLKAAIAQLDALIAANAR